MIWFAHWFRLFWGMVFFGALYYKVTSNSTDNLFWLAIVIDIVGVAICIFSSGRWGWIVLALFQLVFVAIHLFEAEPCNCFGQFQIDRQVLLPIQLFSFVMSVFFFLRSNPDRLSDDRLAAIRPFQLAIPVFVALVLLSASLHSLDQWRLTRSSLDFSVGSEIEMEPQQHGLDDLNILVYHPDCKKCLTRLNSILDDESLSDRRWMFVDVSGDTESSLDIDPKCIWLRTNGIPIGITRLPSTVVVRQRIVTEHD